MIYRFFFILFLNSVIFFSSAYGDKNFSWNAIPITTISQEKSGITGGEGFQQVMSIVYAPSNPNIVFMGTDTTQVWKSVDSGHTWHVSSKGIDSNGVCSLFIPPDNANIILAAGCLGPEKKRAQKSKDRREGVFRSTDGGNNWTFVYKTEFYKQRSMGSLFAIDTRTTNKKELTFYSGSNSDGLLISLDTGKTWKKTKFNKGSITDIESSYSVPGLLIISSSQGLFKYKDGVIKKIGDNFDGIPSNTALSPAAPNRIITAVKDQGIYLSNDNGSTFTESSKGLPPYFLSKIVDVYASPVDASRLYASTWKSRIKGPFYSNNGGKSWNISRSINEKKLTNGGGFWFPSPISPHPEKPLVALAASNGKTRILRTKNGGRTWSYSGSGYTGGRVVDMAFASPENWYIALTDHGLWHTNDNGNTFTNINIPGIHPRSIGSVAVKEKTIVLSIGGWRNKKLAISYDAGNTWKTTDKVTGRLKLVRFHPQKDNVIYASGFRSNNNGETWNKLKYKVRSIFASNGNIVYGFNKAHSDVVKSIDSGETWQKIVHCNIKNISINEMASDPKIEDMLYMATNSGVFLINNKQCKRVRIKSGFTKDTHHSLAVKSIAVNPQKPNIIYAGRWSPGSGVSTGIYVTEDYGRSWSPINNSLIGNYNAWSIEIEPEKATIYSGTTYGLQVLKKSRK